MGTLVDLHRHLDGSLSMETIKLLAERSAIRLPEDALKLERLLTAPENCMSLKEYLMCFELPVKCLQSAENLRDAAYFAGKEAAEQGLWYAEIRFAPLLHTAGGLKCHEAVENVVRGLEKAETDFKIKLRAIVCGMRHMPVGDNIKMLRAAARFFDPERPGAVCGTDTAGNEADFPTMAQAGLFQEAKKLGIPFTVHAGECGSAANVADAVKLGAARIGHGIAIIKDREVMAMCRDMGIALELCPTSNFQTKAVPSHEIYPIRLFMEAGIKVTVNTDNCTVSNTTVKKEFELLKKKFALTEDEMSKLLKNSKESRFGI